MLVHFWEIDFKWQLVCNFDITEYTFFSLFLIFFMRISTYFSTSHNIWLYLVYCLPYFHISNNVLFLPRTTVHSFSIDVFLMLSIPISNIQYSYFDRCQPSCRDTCQIWMWYITGKNVLLILKNKEKYWREEVNLVTPTLWLNILTVSANFSLSPQESGMP